MSLIAWRSSCSSWSAASKSCCTNRSATLLVVHASRLPPKIAPSRIARIPIKTSASQCCTGFGTGSAGSVIMAPQCHGPYHLGLGQVRGPGQSVLVHRALGGPGGFPVGECHEVAVSGAGGVEVVGSFLEFLAQVEQFLFQ